MPRRLDFFRGTSSRRLLLYFTIGLNHQQIVERFRSWYIVAVTVLFGALEIQRPLSLGIRVTPQYSTGRSKRHSGANVKYR
jgi:hypothetical protein